MENEVAKVKNAKDAFFTPAVAHDICYKLINEYFVLNERDLAFWDSDPEGYGELYNRNSYNRLESKP